MTSVVTELLVEMADTIKEHEDRINDLIRVVADHQKFNAEVLKTFESIKATTDCIMLTLSAMGVDDDDEPLPH